MSRKSVIIGSVLQAAAVSCSTGNPAEPVGGERGPSIEAGGAASLDGGDAGTPSSAYDTPLVCTTAVWWTRDDENGSPLMRPGLPCIACHERGEGPSFTIAGTLYPTAHEFDDCYGAQSSLAQVVVTDANGRTYSLPVNAAGNFFTDAPVALPYKAKVVSGSRVREMAPSQRIGDCNECHSAAGRDGAPGRVMIP